MIDRKEVKTFEERIYCDECKYEMTNTKMLPVNPPKYVYECPNCGEENVTHTQYPQTITEAY